MEQHSKQRERHLLAFPKISNTAAKGKLSEFLAKVKWKNALGKEGWFHCELTAMKLEVKCVVVLSLKWPVPRRSCLACS